jgi:ribosome-binding factor A
MSKDHRRSGPRLPRGQQSTLANGEPPGHRQQRLEKILHQELQTLLRDEAADPDLQAIVVVAVELSPDCGNARIAYAVQAAFTLEGQVKVASREALARGNGFLRARLASLLDLKRLPKLSFTFLGVREGGEPWQG